MAKWHVGFDGRWQESFHDFEDAVEWAREVAETGRTVDVAQRRFVVGRKLVGVFPESERAQREAVWSAGAIAGLGLGPYVGGGFGDGGGFGGDGDGGGGGGDGGGGC
jgi:hypothetical protein